VAREVAGIARAMQVLEVLATSPDGCGVKELSRAIGCGKGTISKMLATLERRHYVRQDGASGRFSLTWRLLALAFGHADQAGMPRIFLPVLQELADETDELVQLAVVDGDQVPFVAKAEGRGQTVRLLPLVGVWVPLHATAAGKLWLSTLPPRELSRVIGRQLQPVAPRTITSPSVLRAELARIRHAGYALADEELAEGGRAIAAPIARDGAMVGAVALSGPAYRLSVERLHALAPRLLEAGARLASIWPPHVNAKDFLA
jgi:IclR family transcriptional regulator, acetate operon repressor